MIGEGGSGLRGPSESGPVSVHAPVTACPGGQYRHEPAAQRRVALWAALDGVALGAYDRRVVDWLARDEVPTVAAVVSLILRARATADQAARSGGAR